MDNIQSENIDSAPVYEQLVTVCAYLMPYEADIARSLLAAEEIPAFLMDYETIYINWLYSNALGGVKLQVHKSDLQIASEIIEGAIAGQECIQDFSEGVCPRCNSSKTVSVVYGRRWALLTWLIVSMPLVWPLTRLKCLSCGKVWRDIGEALSGKRGKSENEP